MKNVLHLLVGFLSTGLASCAFGMGRVRCEAPDLPARPQQLVCIANGSGGGGCFDPRQNPPEFHRDSILNFVCADPKENQAQEEWIEQVINSCKGK